MTKLEETSYPRLNAQPSEAEIRKSFFASADEWSYVRSLAHTADARLAALFHLKLHQRLGRFVTLSTVPNVILQKIAQSVKVDRVPTLAALDDYDRSANSRRHLSRIREYRGAKPYDNATAVWLGTLAEKTAEIKSRLPEIIDVLLEELVHHSYDLPSFEALDRIAATAREAVHERYYATVDGLLTPEIRKIIDKLLEAGPHSTTGWNSLKRESRKPTNKEVRQYLQHVVRMRDLASKMPRLTLPIPKHRYFRDVAGSLDASELRKQKPSKRYTFAAIYVRSQFARTLDDAGEIFGKMIRNLENNATTQLTMHQLEHTERAERLIGQLKDVLEAFNLEGSTNNRIDAIANCLVAEPEELIAQCTEHLAYAGKNYIPFLLRPYGAVRPILLNCLNIMGLKSSSDDKVMERMIDALAICRSSKGALLTPDALGLQLPADLEWMKTNWRKHVLVKDATTPGGILVHRKYFELAVLTQLKDEISTGDLFIPGGELFDDFREQVVDDATLEAELPEYSEVSNMPDTAAEFVKRLKAELTAVSDRVDATFPDKTDAKIVDGVVVLSRLKRLPLVDAIRDLDREVTERMIPTTIVDVLIEVSKWLGIERHFKRLVGTEGRIDDLLRRVVLTLFCYGCNLGPTDLARCVKGMSRKQAAWLNLKYVNEETLQRVITDVINAYNKLELPSYWGPGVSASADGKKWTMHENNLMSEYHIRYGGYGGIGYYIVSDTYIALYSRFITCGSYEGHYILDCLMGNSSDIQPNQLHGDTHAQNYVAFGLAPFLGAKLMPRIRRFKELNLYKPSSGKRYKHIEPLFLRAINWSLIERHYRDILRFAVSIKLGRISPSTILRRFNNKSRRNKVHDAMHEVGAVYRTIFLLEYIEDPQLRKTISAATNKSEAFNQFIKWAFFANEGLIDESIRHEQQKLIRYNHIVANMLMYHNVQEMQRVLVELRDEGWEITPEMVAALGPYRTGHINRFGVHDVDVNRSVEPLEKASQILLSSTLRHSPRPGRTEQAA
ncbi:Tn3 family transposase [Tahibacter amnicola]|uniref:Tn3 family transposase n=1 Tax=Tahibacter amnicola TaxID=2976241 RepID=A0ABY6BBM3_9GAMM|nr:Tn3 family transposase [Tahibacter amnicola]UXI66041.1 Tn3 family transposase [Tahibacter amnicola]